MISSQSNIQAFKRYIWILKERKEHSIEKKQQHVSSFFFKTNLFKEWMKKFVALLTTEKRLR